MPRPFCLAVARLRLGLAPRLFTGCQDRRRSPNAVGLVDPARYASAVHDDQVRRLGEDHARDAPQRPAVHGPGDGGERRAWTTFSSSRPCRSTSTSTGDTAGRPPARSSTRNRPTTAGTASSDSPTTPTPAKAAASWSCTPRRPEYDTDHTVRAAGDPGAEPLARSGYMQVFLAGSKDEQPLVRLEAAKALANLPDPTAAGRADRPPSEPTTSKDVRVACRRRPRVLQDRRGRPRPDRRPRRPRLRRRLAGPSLILLPP